jgi:hypothetical protein
MKETKGTSMEAFCGANPMGMVSGQETSFGAQMDDIGGAAGAAFIQVATCSQVDSANQYPRYEPYQQGEAFEAQYEPRTVPDPGTDNYHFDPGEGQPLNGPTSTCGPLCQLAHDTL